MIGAVCAAAALLLLWSGVAKLRRPGPAAQMLVGLLRRPFPAQGLVVRLLGALELTVGLSVLVTGGRTALAALAACYLAFAAVAARLATGVHQAPCGCFGRSETPAGLVHLVVNLVAAAFAVAGALRPFGALAGYGGQDGTVLAVGLGQVVVLAGLAYLVVTALPDVLAAREQVVTGS
jgi:uncharacterized membrane protein YphA (DoxX/SURF4 family)